MGARIRQMKAEGHDIIALNGGEPDFNTPAAIIQRAKEALDQGLTKYSPTPGLPELREAVAAKFKRENGLSVTPGQTIVTNGAKQAVQNALLAILEPGDEVIVIAPYWPTYPDQIRMAGGVPVTVTARFEEGFRPRLDELRAACTPRTKAIIINSPCNPTGAALDREALKEIASVALSRGLWVISDEIYERLTYGFSPTSIASLGSEIAAQTITISGCSKAYSMTGWRIGYACAPTEIISAMNLIQDQQTSGAVTFAQAAAVAALELPEAEVESMRAEFEARLDLMLGRLQAMPGVEVIRPQGAFYLFPRISSFLSDSLPDDTAFTEHLLDKAKVACIPGSCFAAPGHIRMSYACSREAISTGMDRLEAALRELGA